MHLCLFFGLVSESIGLVGSVCWRLFVALLSIMLVVVMFVVRKLSLSSFIVVSIVFFVSVFCL